MSPFVIYSKTGCMYCDKLVEVLSNKGIPFVKKMLGEDFDRDEFITQFGHGSTFPRVLVDGKVIGGLRETAIYLAENDYV